MDAPEILKTALVIGGGLVLAFGLRAVLRNRSERNRFDRAGDPAAFRQMPGLNGADYVRVEDDGSIRELEPFEMDYLATPFSPTDGARPYVKATYDALTPDHRLGGFLHRRNIPPTMTVKDVAEDVTPLRTAAEAIAAAKTAIAAHARPAFVDREALGDFRADLDQGVWRVVRTPDPSEQPTPPPVVGPLPTVMQLSAASGRVVSYGWH